MPQLSLFSWHQDFEPICEPGPGFFFFHQLVIGYCLSGYGYELTEKLQFNTAKCYDGGWWCLCLVFAQLTCIFKSCHDLIPNIWLPMSDELLFPTEFMT